MTIRAAVIGVGNMGTNHARVYSEMPGVELVAVIDRDLARARDVAMRYGSQTAQCLVDNNLDLRDWDVEAVSVCVPTFQHCGVAKWCLLWGIPTLVEKPIADNSDAGEYLRFSATSEGTPLMVGHIERFNPAVIELRKMLQRGVLGRLYQVTARRMGPHPARFADTSVCTDLAVHDLDIIEWATGQRIERIYCTSLGHVVSTHEDAAIAALVLSSGALGSVTVNRLSPVKVRDLTIVGELGMLRCDYLEQELYYTPNGLASEDGWPAECVPTAHGGLVQGIVKAEPLKAEIEAFLSVVRGEIPVPVTAGDGLRALQLAEAMSEASNAGRGLSIGQEGNEA